MLDLVLHPSEARKPRHKVRASVRRIAGSELVTLRFEVEGAANVVWPCHAGGNRRDGLWKETCFECFIAGSVSSDSYCEWNFSPDGDWASYHFDRYREGMRKLEVAAPTIVRTSVADRARFEIDFPLPQELVTGTWASLALSITAVIIEKSADATTAPFYWALTHKGPKPDFHLRESFTLEVEY